MRAAAGDILEIRHDDAAGQLPQNVTRGRAPGLEQIRGSLAPVLLLVCPFPLVELGVDRGPQAVARRSVHGCACGP